MVFVQGPHILGHVLLHVELMKTVMAQRSAAAMAVVLGVLNQVRTKQLPFFWFQFQ